jgi:uncharacterized membrane protein YecN with MAPEG domain
MISHYYLSLLALVFLALSIATIKARKKAQIAVGTEGDKLLLRRNRAHGNFAEYVPIAIMLVYANEFAGAASWLVHGLGALLLVGRLVHAYGISQLKENLKFRVSGMLCTLLSILVGAISLLTLQLMQH